jgi:hypothetical protein
MLPLPVLLVLVLLVIAVLALADPPHRWDMMAICFIAMSVMDLGMSCVAMGVRMFIISDAFRKRNRQGYNYSKTTMKNRGSVLPVVIKIARKKAAAAAANTSPIILTTATTTRTPPILPTTATVVVAAAAATTRQPPKNKRVPNVTNLP